MDHVALHTEHLETCLTLEAGRYFLEVIWSLSNIAVNGSDSFGNGTMNFMEEEA